MNNTKFTVGQEVVLKIIAGSNHYRGLPKEANGKPDILKRLIPTTVKSVGKKYVTVDYGNIKFDMTDEYRQVTNYSAEYELFESAKDAIDADTLESLWDKFRHLVSESYKCPISLNKLERILEIFTEE
jgi:hypothetical protein